MDSEDDVVSAAETAVRSGLSQVHARPRFMNTLTSNGSPRDRTRCSNVRVMANVIGLDVTIGQPSRAAGWHLLLEHRDQLTQFADLWRRLHVSKVDERVAAVLVLWIAEPRQHGGHPLALRDHALATDVQQTDVRVDVVPSDIRIAYGELTMSSNTFGERDWQSPRSLTATNGGIPDVLSARMGELSIALLVPDYKALPPASGNSPGGIHRE